MLRTCLGLSVLLLLVESTLIKRMMSKDIQLLSPQTGKYKGRKPLVLDLDETLVHSSFQPLDEVHIILPAILLIRFT